MKKYVVFIIALMVSSIAFAQSNKEEVDLVQAAFGMEKKNVVANFVQLSEAQKAAFWKIYDEYETKRKELGKERIKVLEVYAREFQTMTPVQADAWTKSLIALQKKTDALIETYYTKVKTATDGLVATQFYQIEAYILTAIRMRILDEVPFVKKP